MHPQLLIMPVRNKCRQRHKTPLPPRQRRISPYLPPRIPRDEVLKPRGKNGLPLLSPINMRIPENLPPHSHPQRGPTPKMHTQRTQHGVGTLHRSKMRGPGNLHQRRTRNPVGDLPSMRGRRSRILPPGDHQGPSLNLPQPLPHIEGRKGITTGGIRHGIDDGKVPQQRGHPKLPGEPPPSGALKKPLHALLPHTRGPLLPRSSPTEMRGRTHHGQRGNPLGILQGQLHPDSPTNGNPGISKPLDPQGIRQPHNKRGKFTHTHPGRNQLRRRPSMPG